jgi:hypothetical protein
MRNDFGRVIGVPGSGERVDADPANWIRDLFHDNDCELPTSELDDALGRMSFTYGQRLWDTWLELQASRYVRYDGRRRLWVWGCF